jgi:hypothetical protein
MVGTNVQGVKEPATESADVHDRRTYGFARLRRFQKVSGLVHGPATVILKARLRRKEAAMTAADVIGAAARVAREMRSIADKRNQKDHRENSEREMFSPGRARLDPVRRTASVRTGLKQTHRGLTPAAILGTIFSEGIR